MIDQRDLLEMPDGEGALDLIERGTYDLPDTQWEGMLVALVAVLEAAFRRLGIDETQATRLAIAAVLAQGDYAGGRQIYIPRGVRLRNALRDAEIYRLAKRGNITELAQRHGLTEVSVYRIIRDQRELHLSKVQGRLDLGEVGR